MITYGEVKASPEGWEDLKVKKDVELAINEVIESYRHLISKDKMLDALMAQRDLVDADHSWPHEVDPTTQEDDGDPEAA